MSDAETSVKRWDVFISHASEDKETVALPLAGWLIRAGLKVWIDTQELRIGDSLREKIEHGLVESRFGVVIISETFLAKRWPLQELNGFTALEEDGQKVILPVWHNVTKSQVARVSPILADRLAANTEQGLQQVAREIIRAALYSTSNSPSTLAPTITRKLVELIDGEKPLSELRDFLLVHNRILASALGFAVFLNEAKLSDLILMVFARHITTAGTMHCTSIVLGPLSGPLFTKRKRPTAKLAGIISALRLDYTKKVIILVGRRDHLDEAQRQCLGDMNERETKIEIRTYDWLVDVFVTWCQEFGA